jgi:hypothetical protein
MALSLVKLAVGAESIKDLQDRVRMRVREAKAKGEPPRHIHVTRMMPKRIDELLGGGSLYWVIKGQIACRERLVAVEPFRDKAGISRCRLVMEPKVFLVSPRPMRPFQGWRYLSADIAPKDLGKGGASIAAMPEKLRRELQELGLL